MWGQRPQASSRPETALFGNFGVRLRISLCGVLEYASAKILILLELAQKSLVSASRTTQFPAEFLDGNGLVPIRKLRRVVAGALEFSDVPTAVLSGTPLEASHPLPSVLKIEREIS